MPPPHPPKYQPLADYLAALPAATERVTLTLPEIETILGAGLPASASASTWWANMASEHQARAWLAPGWRAREIRLRQTPGRVTFVRAAADTIGGPFGRGRA